MSIESVKSFQDRAGRTLENTTMDRSPEARIANNLDDVVTLLADIALSLRVLASGS